jgi:hypothetical protein
VSSILSVVRTTCSITRVPDLKREFYAKLEEALEACLPMLRTLTITGWSRSRDMLRISRLLLSTRDPSLVRLVLEYVRLIDMLPLPHLRH